MRYSALVWLNYRCLEESQNGKERSVDSMTAGSTGHADSCERPDRRRREHGAGRGQDERDLHDALPSTESDNQIGCLPWREGRRHILKVQ